MSRPPASTRRRARAFGETITSLQRETGMTIFLTTHYMEEAAEADYVIVIDNGSIVAKGNAFRPQGTVYERQAHPRLPRSRMRYPPHALPRKGLANSVVVANRVTQYRFRTRSPRCRCWSAFTINSPALRSPRARWTRRLSPSPERRFANDAPKIKQSPTLSFCCRLLGGIHMINFTKRNLLVFFKDKASVFFLAAVGVHHHWHVRAVPWRCLDAVA